MRDAQPRTLQYYRTPTGRAPFNEWLKGIPDRTTRNRIEARLDYLKAGNFGDCEAIGDGIFELRLHFGAGYRIYFGQVGNTVVLLLCGGDKSRQHRDIQRAKTYWKEYKETHS